MKGRLEGYHVLVPRHGRSWCSAYRACEFYVHLSNVNRIKDVTDVTCPWPTVCYNRGHRPAPDDSYFVSIRIVNPAALKQVSFSYWQVHINMILCKIIYSICKQVIRYWPNRPNSYKGCAHVSHDFYSKASSRDICGYKFNRQVALFTTHARTFSQTTWDRIFISNIGALSSLLRSMLSSTSLSVTRGLSVPCSLYLKILR